MLHPGSGFVFLGSQLFAAVAIPPLVFAPSTRGARSRPELCQVINGTSGAGKAGEHPRVSFYRQESNSRMCYRCMVQVPANTGQALCKDRERDRPCLKELTIHKDTGQEGEWRYEKHCNLPKLSSRPVAKAGIEARSPDSQASALPPRSHCLPGAIWTFAPVTRS